MNRLEVAIKRRAFGDAIILKDVAFSAEPGERIAILGPSGTGKSTLLSAIAGLGPGFDGAVSGGGRIAFVFQNPRLIPWRTLLQNLMIAAPDQTEQAARDALGEVGLSEAADQHPQKTSLGMQRRAALARALLLKPDLLLMDEPLASLDVDAAAAMRDLILQTLDNTGATALIATHDRREALILADRVLEIDGKPATVLRDRVSPLNRQDRGDAGLIEDLHKEWFE